MQQDQGVKFNIWAKTLRRKSEPELIKDIQEWQFWLREQQQSIHVKRNLAIEGNKRAIADVESWDAALLLVKNCIVQPLVYTLQLKQRSNRKNNNVEVLSIDAFTLEFGDMLRSAGGGRYKILCPYHNDKNSPSMLVYEEGHAHCFTCNAHCSIAMLANVLRTMHISDINEEK